MQQHYKPKKWLRPISKFVVFKSAFQIVNYFCLEEHNIDDEVTIRICSSGSHSDIGYNLKPDTIKWK